MLFFAFICRWISRVCGTCTYIALYMCVTHITYTILCGSRVPQRRSATEDVRAKLSTLPPPLLSSLCPNPSQGDDFFKMASLVSFANCANVDKWLVLYIQLCEIYPLFLVKKKKIFKQLKNCCVFFYSLFVFIKWILKQIMY